jgi:hypothetical protein
LDIKAISATAMSCLAQAGSCSDKKDFAIHGQKQQQLIPT